MADCVKGKWVPRGRGPSAGFPQLGGMLYTRGAFIAVVYFEGSFAIPIRKLDLSIEGMDGIAVAPDKHADYLAVMDRCRGPATMSFEAGKVLMHFESNDGGDVISMEFVPETVFDTGYFSRVLRA